MSSNERRLTFSVTSGTIFAFHKLPLKDYLIAIAIFTNAVKGISALQLSRDLDVQYKTAFVLAHKIRESLMEQRDESALAGEIHLDGAYVNGHIRPKNKKSERIDRRLAKHQKPGKRCVFVMRQKCAELADSKMVGGHRTQPLPRQLRQRGRVPRGHPPLGEWRHLQRHREEVREDAHEPRLVRLLAGEQAADREAGGVAPPDPRYMRAIVMSYNTRCDSSHERTNHERQEG